MPFLPPPQRPTIITSKGGAEIGVDKVKVEGKERILKRGEVCEIHLLNFHFLPSRSRTLPVV